MNGVASRELGKRTSNVLVDDRSNTALVCNVCFLHSQIRACLSDALARLVIGIVAVVDGVLKRVDVPAGLEVT